MRGGVDLVIVASEFPDYDTLLQELPSATRDTPPKIILTTTDGEPPEAVRRADIVLTKPFHLSELDAAIASFVARNPAELLLELGEPEGIAPI